MAEFDVAEVEEAFRAFWQAGMIREDWDAWADSFTEDVLYLERHLGTKRGREEVRAWIKPLMEKYTSIYGVYEWHTVDPCGRVVLYMQNRRDRPGGGEPIDFAGMTILQYAGDGLWSKEEDFWATLDATEAYKQYSALAKAHDPRHPERRTRLDWGGGPDWTRGPGSFWDHPAHVSRKPADLD